MVPVRDVIILPTFNAVEHTLSHTTNFIQSPEAAHFAEGSLYFVRQTPVVGETVLAPVLLKSADMVKFWWNVVQYPIPSKAAVGEFTDNFMTGTKFRIRYAGREVSARVFIQRGLKLFQFSGETHNDYSFSSFAFIIALTPLRSCLCYCLRFICTPNNLIKQ